MGHSNELMNSISPHNIIEINIFGISVGISSSIIIMWIVMIIIIIGARWMTYKLKSVPETKRQNIAEVIVQGLNSFSKEMIGHNYKEYVAFIGTMFIFLVMANMISIFNIFPSAENLYNITHWEFFEHIPSIHIQPPTKDLNVTFALAFTAVGMTVIAGIKTKRLGGFFKSLADPTPIIAPIKVLEYFIRILSLSLRLFGNILGAFIVMEILYMLLPIMLPAVFSVYFDLFDGILQAFIFVFLTAIYLGEAVE